MGTSGETPLTQAQIAKLNALANGGAADFRQMRLSQQLVERIVASARDADENTVLVDATFDGSVFESDVTFSRVQFKGNASFADAVFEREARFNGARFGSDARFEGATFVGPAVFGGAEFDGRCLFAGATFEADALFNGGSVAGHAVFDAAKFKGSTLFMRRDFQGPASFQTEALEAMFERIARFDQATWRDGISFLNTRFGGETSFSGVAFFGKCVFEGAAFAIGCSFAAARFECTDLVLDAAVFPNRQEIAGSTPHLSCKRARFLNGANLRLDDAVADLTEAEFAQPSTLGGRDLRVLSMKGAYVRDLTLVGADLSRCRFAGAHSLDELSVDDANFASSPAGWRWSMRDVIVEECLWRARVQRQPDWRAAAKPTELERRFAADMVTDEMDGDPPDPRQIAVVYRQLRKGKEDSKDEPGAASFYYGEMEMRRHVRPRAHGPTSALGFAAERSVIWTYWLVSGYALRAIRALIALAVTVVGCAALLQWFGFSPRPSFTRAILLSAQSSSSLLRTSQTTHFTLTSGGEIVVMVLRILGPLFLGLFLLSLRGRVKR